MGDLGLVVLVIVLVAAFVGGMIARSLRLPVILGYLVGGIVIGPHALGLVSDVGQIETLAEIGVVLLLFTLGMEFSLKSLRQIGKVAVLGGVLQILLTAGLGIGVGLLLGWELKEAIFFGFLISLSSTMVVLKLLMERGEMDTAHGRVMIGILLVQDLAVVPMIVILPTMGEPGWVSALGTAVLTATLFLATMLALGLWVMPRLMRWVALVRSREIFLLSVFGFCMAVAYVADHYGLSLALGAFVAGLLISESDYARQALAEVVPLRDIFATLFFVSLGMLVDPSFLVENAAVVSVVVIAIVAGKFVICALVPWIFGYSAKTTLFVGGGLFQIGEFSFILAAVALSTGGISEYLYNLTLTSAAITILLTPFAFGGVSLLYRKLSQRKRFSGILTRHADAQFSKGPELVNHVVICGHGRVGRDLGQVLTRRGFTYLAVDIDPRVIDSLRGRGIPCIYGDASHPEILSGASLDKAKVLVVAFHDPISTELTVKNTLQINPKLDIVARVHLDGEAKALRSLGVNELVRPEFEAGLEIIRHTLHRFGLTGAEIQYIVTGLREEGLE